MGRAASCNSAGGPPPPAAVRGNDWRAVAVEPLAAFVPRLPVSVVVPCHEAPRALVLTLAALERQTYPRELFEVVVVDDGSEPPLTRPASPLDLRVVRQRRRGFGLARARNRGVRAAMHDVIVFLDGDLLAEAELLAAHARWHHAVADALTLGFCRYVAVDGVRAGDVRHPPGSLADLLAERPHDPPWTERHMARTDDLTVSRDDLFRAVVGNNLGMRRAFVEEVGGFDESFDRYGWEDTEFGYRVQARGGLLVPERAALAWHQGRFELNQRPGKRCDLAAQRTKGAGLIPHPDFRPERRAGGWAVPRSVVTVDTAGAEVARAVDTVARLLAGTDGDLAVLVDPGPGRAAYGATLQARFGEDPRVRIGADGDALDVFPTSAFHVTLRAGAAVVPGLLPGLRAGLGRAVAGEAVLADGAWVTVSRAWALHRARRAGGQAADYGPAAAFRIRPDRWSSAWLAALDDRLPHAGRPLRGLPRLVAEANRIRDPRDVRRFARWLVAGVRWWLGSRRGLGRRARL